MWRKYKKLSFISQGNLDNIYVSRYTKITPAELFNFENEEILRLSENPSESLELWKILRNKKAEQIKKIIEIAKAVFD